MTPETRNRSALPAALFLGALLAMAALFPMGAEPGPATNPGGAAELSPSSNGAISPQDQADALHLVIATDRAQYCGLFVALKGRGGRSAGAGADRAGSLPLPCEMFRRSAESIQGKGAEFSFALRSLHPLDPRDAPQTELERRGLESIARHPTKNYYGREMLGGRRYFTGVYPDLPAAAACVDCHNRRSAATGHRYTAGEPMGGVVVRIPLEF